MPKWRWVMRKVAAWLNLILLVCVVIQVFLAGAYLFGGMTIDAHINFVHLFEMIPLLLILFGFLGRNKWMGIGGIVLFVLIAAQYAVIAIGGMVAAAHAVNALIIFGVSLMLLQRSPPWKRMRPVDGPASAS